MTKLALAWVVLFCGVLHAELGFHFLSDADTPAAILAGRDSVFQLVVPAGATKSVAIVGLDETAFQEIAANISKGRWRPDIRVPSIVGQLRLCREREISACEIADGLQVSTAFLLRDPRLVIATYHGVETYLALIQDKLGLLAEDLVGIEMPFTLLGSDGEIARAASLELVTFAPRKLGGADLSVFTAGGLEARSGLLFQQEPSLTSKTDLFAIGFPGATTSRAALGLRDAEEDTLAWTRGHLTGAGALARTEYRNFVFSYSLLRPLENSILVSNLDGNGGLSGGPIMNADGAVVAVVTSGVFVAEGAAPSAMVSTNLVKFVREELKLEAQ